VGAEELCFDISKTNKLNFSKSWITIENILHLAEAAYDFLGSKEVDIVSVELDGNNYYFTEKLLSNGLIPSVWVCEYNAKFPVGAEWVMHYAENHT